MMFTQIDFDLQLGADPTTGEPVIDAESLAALKQNAYDAFFETEVGELLAKRTNNLGRLLNRFATEFERRFGSDCNYPLTPFSERLESIGRDLLLADAENVPVPVPQKALLVEKSEADVHYELVMEFRRLMADDTTSSATISQLRESSIRHRKAWADANDPSYGVAPAEGEEPDADVAKFAHLLNNHILKYGTPKECAGFVVLKIGEREYRYPVLEFRAITDEALRLNLVQ